MVFFVSYMEQSNFRLNVRYKENKNMVSVPCTIRSKQTKAKI